MLNEKQKDAIDLLKKLGWITKQHVANIDAPKLCGNCEHWYCSSEKEFEKLGELTTGSCHRYPPEVPNAYRSKETGITMLETPLDEVISTDHPITFAGDWCGEFKCMDVPRWLS